MIEISIYDKESNANYMVVDGATVYKLQLNTDEYRGLCDEFWKRNPVWVQSFGKLLGGPTIYGARLGLKECPQPRISMEWLLSRREEWKIDLDKSFDLLLWNLHERTNKFLAERSGRA